MSNPQFLTIAGRWRQHAAASGIEHRLSKRDQALAMMMFYAGFSAALDAALELAEYPEDQAMQLMMSLSKEVQQVEAMATQLASGAQPN
jgi:hypothetical protein